LSFAPIFVIFAPFLVYESSSLIRLLVAVSSLSRVSSITAKHHNKTKKNQFICLISLYWEINIFLQMHSRGNESIPDPAGMSSIPRDRDRNPDQLYRTVRLCYIILISQVGPIIDPDYRYFGSQ
jgi:hypothetical protein